MSAFTRLHRIRYGSMNLESPSPPANSTGFTGFGLKESSSGTAGVRPYPFALTKTEMKEFWERIKTWNLNTNISAGGFGFANAAMVPSATDELDLVESSVSFGADPTGGVGGFTLTLFAASYINDDPDYYPHVRITGGIDPGDGINSVVFNDDSTDASVVPNSGSFVATLWGNNVTIYYKSAGDGGGSSCVLTPSSYWPYCAADETAIYNTSTGAQLQSPLN